MTGEEAKKRLEAQYKRQNQYIQKKYDRVSVTLPKGTKDLIKKSGLSVNSFIVDAVLVELSKRKISAGGSSVQSVPSVSPSDVGCGSSVSLADVDLSEYPSPEEFANLPLEHKNNYYRQFMLAHGVDVDNHDNNNDLNYVLEVRRAFDRLMGLDKVKIDLSDIV